MNLDEETHKQVAAQLRKPEVDFNGTPMHTKSTIICAIANV